MAIATLKLRSGCGGHRRACITGLTASIWRAWSSQLKRKATYLLYGYHSAYHNLTRKHYVMLTTLQHPAMVVGQPQEKTQLTQGRQIELRCQFNFASSYPQDWSSSMPTYVPSKLCSRLLRRTAAPPAL